MDNPKKLEALIDFWKGSVILNMCNSYILLEKCKCGPFSLMHKWMENQIEVVILTRSLKSFRSIIIGNLIAFDKHWNLVSFKLQIFIIIL